MVTQDRRKARQPFLKRHLGRLMNLYPPYLGAGVRVTHMAPDHSRFEVEMKLRWWNRNYMGTHFGGSLYSLCDPFFVIIMIEQLGPGFVVWDKAASIRFRRPGRGRVRASFHIPPEEVQRVRSLAEAEGKVEPVYTVEVLDDHDECVATVEKRLSVRRKDPRSGQDKGPASRTGVEQAG